MHLTKIVDNKIRINFEEENNQDSLLLWAFGILIKIFILFATKIEIDKICLTKLHYLHHHCLYLISH